MTVYITGTAVTVGRFSGNGWLFLPSELKPLHGKTIPLLWQHIGTPSKKGESIQPQHIIGEATTYWHELSVELRYYGEVKEQFAELVNKANGVSVGAHFRQLGAWACDILLEEISLTESPSVDGTSIHILDLASKMKLQSHLKSGA
jgi:hypothetical protein